MFNSVNLISILQSHSRNNAKGSLNLINIIAILVILHASIHVYVSNPEHAHAMQWTESPK